MKLVNKFQMGGPVEDPNAVVAAPAEEPIGAPAGGSQDPMQMIVEMFVQGLQNQDCEALAQGAQMFLQLIQDAQGGGAPEGQPVFAKGGKLVGYTR